MFCPNCGKDNLNQQKFCATCGTNLEAVSQLLSGTGSDFFTRIDSGLDQFIAKYAEHIFRDAPSAAIDRSVSNSWKILGKGVLTSFVDLLLALVIWNVFTVRFNILFFSTPFRLLSERSRRLREPKAGTDTDSVLRLPEPPINQWLPGAAPSVSEHTTEHLREYRPSGHESSDET